MSGVWSAPLILKVIVSLERLIVPSLSCVARNVYAKRVEYMAGAIAFPRGEVAEVPPVAFGPTFNICLVGLVIFQVFNVLLNQIQMLIELSLIILGTVGTNGRHHVEEIEPRASRRVLSAFERQSCVSGDYGDVCCHIELAFVTGGCVD